MSKKNTATPFFDIEAAKQFLENKHKKRDDNIRKLFEKATADFNVIKEMLIRKYDPFRIYQWGSLLYPERFCEISDIDIAVEGIPDAETFFALFGDAWDMTDFPLDLVEIDKINPVYAKSIREKGRLVYERKAKSV